MTLKNLLCCWLPLCACMQAQEFEVHYAFTGVGAGSGSVSPAPSPTLSGAVFGGFTATGVSAQPNASDRFSFTGWPAGATDGEDDPAQFTGALSPFSYYEVRITTQPGYTLSLDEMTFSMRRSSTGPRTFCARSSFNSFNNNLAASTGTNTKLMVLPGDVFFWKSDQASATSDQKGCSVTFGGTHDGITGTVDLRIYAWNAESNGGSFSIDDVLLKGRLADSALVAGISATGRAQCKILLGRQLQLVPCGFVAWKVYDLGGHNCAEWEAARSLSLPDLPDGLYVVILQYPQGVTTRRCIVRQD